MLGTISLKFRHLVCIFYHGVVLHYLVVDAQYIYLFVNGKPKVRSFIYQQLIFGIDVSSQSLLLPLVALDAVKLLASSGPIYSDSNY